MKTNGLRRIAFPLAGAALILAANAAALVGAYYNRSEPPDSVLSLSDRELQRPYNFGLNTDNSGVALRLVWRQEGMPHSQERGAPWLDKAKLKSLGFDLRTTPEHESGRDFDLLPKYLPKQVLLVLEFDGPSYERARARAEEDEAGESPKQHAFRLAREQSEASRLFVVDAGLDLDELRARYPDTRHYSVVRGRVLPIFWLDEDKNMVVSGMVTHVDIDSINVPLVHQAAIGVISNPDARDAQGHPFKASRFKAVIAFGKRLEPWIVSAEQTN